jgi:hypothetical protein
VEALVLRSPGEGGSAKADDSNLAIFRQKALDTFHNTVVLLPSMTPNRHIGQGRLRRQALCASRAIPSATADVCQNIGHHLFESFTGRICRPGPSNRLKQLKPSKTEYFFLFFMPAKGKRQQPIIGLRPKQAKQQQNGVKK